MILARLLLRHRGYLHAPISRAVAELTATRVKSLVVRVPKAVHRSNSRRGSAVMGHPRRFCPDRVGSA
jgi:hypothetical protein